MIELVSRNVHLRAEAVFGQQGPLLIQSMISRIREVYRYVAPETATAGVTVVRSPVDGDTPASLAGVSDGKKIAEIAALGSDYRDGVTVIELPNGHFQVSAEVLSPSDCSTEDVIYHLGPGDSEHFVIGGERIEVEHAEDFVSAFARPTFADLEEALNQYAVHARYGTLHGLQELWRDDRRLMFRPKPERGMRRSMESFLEATLRATKDIELRPEQNVDETKPVDIKVTFSHSNRRAYIEIKWMGDSAPPPPTTKKPTKYRDSRATKGAIQLAEYLDNDKPRSTGLIVTGYLVVYDARRRRITPNTTRVDSEKGMYYADKEVEYDEGLLARSDLAPPRRMFMEPLCEG